MTPGESRFVEEMGQFLGSLGMTPMAGRMWGWLLICDPPEQTALEMAEALRASRGAISGTARILASAGMIRRSTRRGDRREYFSAPPEALESLMRNGGRIYDELARIAERGLASIADRPPEARERLQEMRDVLAYVSTEIPLVAERFIRDRAARLADEASETSEAPGAGERSQATGRATHEAPGVAATEPANDAEPVSA
jgi:DNA-binding transcriptional regulator GbsR (MarR family)